MAVQSRITALVGGQYGSEGKGVIAAHIAKEYDLHIRTGGPNAGHSFIHRGEIFAMQTVPCGWINYDATLMIGAGGMVDIDTLIKEVDMVLPYDPMITSRLLIDPNTGIIDKHHKQAEGGTKGEIHQRIGSTGKGVGAARADRLNRTPDKARLFKHLLEETRIEFADGSCVQDMIVPTVPIIHDMTTGKNPVNVLLEGAQGAGLSLIHGPWPYVTSADTNAAQLAADAGIAPQRVTDVILVVRSYPIRVAGNSGPLEYEVDWNHISKIMGRPMEEKTTVTKKIRRIGRWDEKLFLQGVMLNSPTAIAFTFADYLNPVDEGKGDWKHLSDKNRQFVSYLERISGTPVDFVSTGGENLAVIDRR